MLHWEQHDRGRTDVAAPAQHEVHKERDKRRCQQNIADRSEAMRKGVAPRWEGPYFEDVFVVAAGRNEVCAALEVFGLLAKSSENISDLLRILR